MVTNIGDWRPISSAPRDGSRVLVVIRATEQGPGEVDVARWGRPQRSSEKCWIAADSDPACQIVYADPEVLYWMPMPSHAPESRAAVLSSRLPDAPRFAEGEGSGI